MANTITDKTLTGDVWQNAYSLSGLSVGTALLIQAKSSGPTYVVTAASQPSASARDGLYLEEGEQSYVTAGEAGCWLFGVGKVSIQQG